MYESPEHEGMYSIGTLSRIVGISTDTLRYYDEIGLLKPAYVSGETGYRYYLDDQAATLVRIMELKRYGFSLGEIKSILEMGQMSLADVYLNRYWVLEDQKAKLQLAIDNLLEKINRKQEDYTMDKKILIVDDAPFMRSMCKEILSKEGYDVVGEARDGLEAVDLCGKLRPDIVLLDIVMPNLDGIEALGKIKERDNDICVIMLSAMSQAWMVTKALMAGANGFIAKPFQSEDLLCKIKGISLQENIYNQAILQKIHDATVDDTRLLTTIEIDIIINSARTLTDLEDVADIITQIGKSPAEQQGYDPSIEQKTEILARLDRLEQGQAKILEMLQAR
jgi:two-component system chemotaxis response regulator CheY